MHTEFDVRCKVQDLRAKHGKDALVNAKQILALIPFAMEGKVRFWTEVTNRLI